MLLASCVVNNGQNTLVFSHLNRTQNSTFLWRFLFQNNHKEELDKVKNHYETELAEARRLLVEQDLELKNMRLEMEKLREKASQHATNEQMAKDLAEQLQAQVDELTMQLTSAKSLSVSHCTLPIAYCENQKNYTLFYNYLGQMQMQGWLQNKALQMPRK